MFEYQPKRHPLQTFQFWFLVIVCAAGVGAWRTGLITLPVSQDSGREDIDITFDNYEPMPPPPHGDTTDASPKEEPAGNEASASPPPQYEEQVAEETTEPNPLTTDVNSASPILGDAPNWEPQVVDASSENSEPTQSGIVLAAHMEIAEPKAPPQSADLQSTPSPNRTEPPKPIFVADEIKPILLDFTEVDALIQRGDDVTALRQLSIWYWERPNDRSELQERLTALSRRIFFRPHPHYVEPHQVAFGDRFETIAKKYNVPWEYLSKINHTPPEKLRAGQKLKVINGPFNVVVNLSDFELTVHTEGYFVVRMPIGIGKDESTPVGTFRVTDKVQDPIYYGPDEVIAADDPMNPLGEFWIAFSDEAETIQGFGIHGTTDPSSIGQATSKGCVRLHDQHIEDLYNLLTIGSEVVIRR